MPKSRTKRKRAAQRDNPTDDNIMTDEGADEGPGGSSQFIVDFDIALLKVPAGSPPVATRQTRSSKRGSATAQTVARPAPKRARKAATQPEVPRAPSISMSSSLSDSDNGGSPLAHHNADAARDAREQGDPIQMDVDGGDEQGDEAEAQPSRHAERYMAQVSSIVHCEYSKARTDLVIGSNIHRRCRKRRAKHADAGLAGSD